MKVRSFEVDDFPRHAEELIASLDDIKAQWPQLKVTIFAIPAEMRRRHHRLIDRRRDWIVLAPHGFVHRHRECRDATWWRPQLTTLDRLARDERYVKLFKSPWTGYEPAFIDEAAARGFAIVAKHYVNLPKPMPAHWLNWNLQDARVAAGWGDQGAHVEAHPCYPRNPLKASKTKLDAKHIARWVETWQADDQWVYSHELVRPMLIKINLGCGFQVFDGWHCLDCRREGLDPRVRYWRAQDLIPFGENKADFICQSHLLEYLPEEDWIPLFLEVWRVLRPRAIYRIQDTATESGFVWRRPGENTYHTGEIRSFPATPKVIAALERVGFVCRRKEMGETDSWHKDICLADSRPKRLQKGQKFLLEAEKAIDIKNEAHPRYHDPRATKSGRYRLPPLPA
jgi:hypothetical protein